jgi:hypothetical protein
MFPWAKDIVATYAAHASNQFIISGNINDRMLLPNGKLGSLEDYLKEVILPKFDVIYTYDLGNGLISVRETSPPIFPQFDPAAFRHPRAAMEAMTKFFRSLNAYRSIRPNDPVKKVAFIVRAAQLVAPIQPNGSTYDVSAIAMLVRDWTNNSAILANDIATFLLTENLNDLHPMIVSNSRATKVQIPMPSKDDIFNAINAVGGNYREAIHDYDYVVGPDASRDGIRRLSSRLAGLSVGTIERLLQTKHHKKERVKDEDLVQIKKELIERDANGLISFMQSTRSLSDFTQSPTIRDYLLKDVDLWRQGNIDAMPMGYLLSAPVGCGKGYLVECMAGSFGVPFITIGQFRDKYQGVAESNLERIFRMAKAASPCVVFIDEIDQTMGKRNTEGDSGVSGRIYSMFASEMSNPANRGKIIWVGATSRPDLLEIDLKRPGRMDVKIPILPAASKEDAYALFTSILKRYKSNRGPIVVPDGADVDGLKKIMPDLLTAGAANALASKVCRTILVTDKPVEDAIRESMSGYQNPVPLETLEFQMRIAIAEASDLDFVPKVFRERFSA